MLENSGEPIVLTQRFAWSEVKGLILMLISVTFMAVMSLSIKLAYLNSNISPYEVMYWRGIMGFLLNFGIAILAMSASQKQKADPLDVNLLEIENEDKEANLLKVKPKYLKSLLLRMLCGVVCFLTFFISTKYLPVSLVSVLDSLHPFFAAFFGLLILNERISKYDMIACVIAMGGMIIIIFNPYHEEEGDNNNNNNNNNNNEMNYNYVWVPCMGAVAGGGSIVFTRATKEIHYSISPTYLQLACTLLLGGFSLLHAGVVGHLTTYSYTVVFILLMMGLSGGFGHCLFSMAAQYDKAGRLAVICYIETIELIFADFLILGTKISLLDIIGAACILGTNLTIGVLKGCKIID